MTWRATSQPCPTHFVGRKRIAHQIQRGAPLRENHDLGLLPAPLPVDRVWQTLLGRSPVRQTDGYSVKYSYDI